MMLDSIENRTYAAASNTVRRCAGTYKWHLVVLQLEKYFIDFEQILGGHVFYKL